MFASGEAVAGSCGGCGERPPWLAGLAGLEPDDSWSSSPSATIDSILRSWHEALANCWAAVEAWGSGGGGAAAGPGVAAPVPLVLPPVPPSPGGPCAGRRRASRLPPPLLVLRRVLLLLLLLLSKLSSVTTPC
jgi:hypothetical protein